MAVLCPECDNRLDINPDEVEEGDAVHCEECGTEIQIVSLDPLEIAAVDETGYDDEDDAVSSTDEDEE